MKAKFSIGAVALALILAGCGGGGANESGPVSNEPLKQIAAPNNGDWTQIVTQTPEGGVRMGNPDAPVKLVEYASLACPHCKDFSAQGTAALRDTYVRSGQVSWEYRPFLLNAPDVAFTLLARCQPPASFFRTIEQMFEQQTEFFNALDDTESQRIAALPPEQQIVPLARAMDLDTFFARRGTPEASFVQCLSNRQAIQDLTDRTQRAATEENVTGTPTFFINGTKQQADTWARLEPLLRTALGQ